MMLSLPLGELTQPITVPLHELNRLLGYPAGYVPHDRSHELADEVRVWFDDNVRPWSSAVEVRIASKLDENVILEDGTVLQSATLAEKLRLASASGAVVVAVTVGTIVDEKMTSFWEQDRPDLAYFLSSYASAAVEQLIARLGMTICDWAEPTGLAALTHYSPGYDGWDIADQRKLMDLLRQEPRSPIDNHLRLLDSGSLAPTKSMLGFIALTADKEVFARHAHLIPCQSCSMPDCDYRRVPQSEPSADCASPAMVPPPTLPVPTVRKTDHAYAYPNKALQRWHRDLLTIHSVDDQGVKASFLFEGNTCSNMGIPLSFVYDIELGPAAERFPVRSLECRPAPGDNGFQSMCSYSDNPEVFAKTMVEAPDLINWTLDRLLDWDPVISPAGCLCHDSHRNHKWKAALQTLHYGLMRHEAIST